MIKAIARKPPKSSKRADIIKAPDVFVKELGNFWVSMEIFFRRNCARKELGDYIKA